MFSRNTADYNGYASMVSELGEGNWRAHNLYTAEPHPPFQIRSLFLLLGKTAAVFPDVSVVTILEIGRWVLSVVLLFLIAARVRRFFKKTTEIFFTFVFVLLAGGFSWMTLIENSPEQLMVKMNTFLAFLSPPPLCPFFILAAGNMALFGESMDRKGYMLCLSSRGSEPLARIR